MSIVNVLILKGRGRMLSVIGDVTYWMFRKISSNYGSLKVS